MLFSNPLFNRIFGLFYFFLLHRVTINGFANLFDFERRNNIGYLSLLLRSFLPCNDKGMQIKAKLFDAQYVLCI